MKLCRKIVIDELLLAPKVCLLAVKSKEELGKFVRNKFECPFRVLNVNGELKWKLSLCSVRGCNCY